MIVNNIYEFFVNFGYVVYGIITNLGKAIYNGANYVSDNLFSAMSYKAIVQYLSETSNPFASVVNVGSMADSLNRSINIANKIIAVPNYIISKVLSLFKITQLGTPFIIIIELVSIFGIGYLVIHMIGKLYRSIKDIIVPFN